MRTYFATHPTETMTAMIIRDSARAFLPVRSIACAAAAAALLALSPSRAALAQPEHDCYQPEVPVDIVEEEEKEAFMEEARAYVDCMREFFDEQADLSRQHAEAANTAKDEMEEFAALINE